MNVLFVLASPEYLRFFDESIVEMTRRGWRVTVVANAQDPRKPVRLEAFAASVPGVTQLGLLPERHGPWAALAQGVRGTMDFVRYLDPRYRDAVLLRDRTRRKAVPRWLRWLDLYETLPDEKRERVLSWLRFIEESIPTSRKLDALLASVKPDVVVVSPLVDVGSDQVDIVRSARAAGIPVAVAIASWDNLTNKGLLRTTVDRVIVWNEAQRAEAQALHGLQPELVSVTGAQPFDRWFTRQPSRSREQFCRDVGLKDDRPFVLFTGSSVFISRGPDEIAFVQRWLDSVRGSAALADVAVLVRPHPYNGVFWTDVELPGYRHVAIWPKGAFDPTDDQNRADYFDSLYYCAAVVGINTSAMVEAAILSKPVLTIRTTEFEGTQGGTLHFSHLLPDQGGCVQIGATMAEHIAQLEAAVTQPEASTAMARRFVGSFLRPHGADAPCVPFFVDAVSVTKFESPAAAPPGPVRVAAAALLAVLVSVLDLVSTAVYTFVAAEIWRETLRAIQKIPKYLHPVRRGKDLRDYTVKGWRRTSRRWRGRIRDVRQRVSLRRLRQRTDRLRKVGIGAARQLRRRAGRAARAVVALPRRGARFVVARVTGRPLPQPPQDDGGPLTILFSVRSFWYVKLFESAVRELAARGHRIHLIADVGDRDPRAQVWEDAARRVAADCPSVTVGYLPVPASTEWDVLASAFRLASDYLRYFSATYDDAPRLKERAETRVPPTLLRWLQSWPWRGRPGRWAARRLLALAESSMPDRPELVEYLRTLRPDVVLISPLVTLGSEQFDLLRASRRLRLRTAFAAGSWDHLSSKALIRDVPDAVLVWNHTQRDEAVRLHGVPAARVVVTGAQCFDTWFDRTPAVDAAEFRRRVGLDPARPHIAYVCSALFEGSPSEAAFVADWVAALRGSGSADLQTCGILVRPHPKRLEQWQSVDLSAWPNVTLWPPTGDAPFDEATRDDYFHSLHHAAAVVGLNTSALIEGAVMGRSVHTVLLPEFRENQEGTLHFRYLLDVGGGLLCASRSVPEHVERLATALREGWTSPPAFVEAFVRPNGLARAATPIFADAIERIGRAPLRPAAREPWLAPAVRRLVRPLADDVEGSAKVKRRLYKSGKERARAERIAQKEQMRADAMRRRIAEAEAAGKLRRVEELKATEKYR